MNVAQSFKTYLVKSFDYYYKYRSWYDQKNFTIATSMYASVNDYLSGHFLRKVINETPSRTSLDDIKTFCKSLDRSSFQL